MRVFCRNCIHKKDLRLVDGSWRNYCDTYTEYSRDGWYTDEDIDCGYFIEELTFGGYTETNQLRYFNPMV